jgi:hypothetical protein
MAVVSTLSSCATYSAHVPRPEASSDARADIEDSLRDNIYKWAVKVEFRDRAFSVTTIRLTEIVQDNVRCDRIAQTRIGLGFGNFTVHIIEKSGEDVLLSWSKREDVAERLVDAIAAFCADPKQAPAAEKPVERASAPGSLRRSAPCNRLR